MNSIRLLLICIILFITLKGVSQNEYDNILKEKYYPEIDSKITIKVQNEIIDPEPSSILYLEVEIQADTDHVGERGLNYLKGPGEISISYPKKSGISIPNDNRYPFELYIHKNWPKRTEKHTYHEIRKYLSTVDLLTMNPWQTVGNALPWGGDLLEGILSYLSSNAIPISNAFTFVVNDIIGTWQLRNLSYGNKPKGNKWKDTDNYLMRSFGFDLGPMTSGWSANKIVGRLPLRINNPGPNIPISIYGLFTWWNGLYTVKKSGYQCDFNVKLKDNSKLSISVPSNNQSSENNKTFIALILDSSGSMEQSDPHDMRKKAAKAILQLLDENTHVFLVDFDNQARWINPNQWKNYSISDLENAISTIDSDGGTQIGRGLNRMRQILENQQSNISNGAVLLLSDGKSNYQNEAQWFANQQIPIYTVSYRGKGNGQLLSSIASKTGGQYIKAYDESDVIAAFEDFHYQLKGYSPIMKLTDKINQDQIITTTFESDPNASEMAATTSWQGSKIAVKLISPNGKEYVESDQNAQWNIRNNYVTTRIENPASGKWKVELKGVKIPAEGETFTFHVNEDSPHKINLDMEKSSTGNIHLKLNQNNSNINLNKLNPQIHVTTPSRKTLNLSTNFRNSSLNYLPAQGKGSYKFRIRFKATTSNGQPIQRDFERSVYIGDSTVTNAARVEQVTGNYLRSPLGKNSGNQVGIHCTIYDESDSTNTRAKAKGIVTYVAPNWCNIEIQRYLGGSYKISTGDIIRLDFKQWQNDQMPN